MKYPRTPHLYNSPGATTDDKRHQSWDRFLNRELVITEKLDGGNTAIHDGVTYSRGGTADHPTFNYIKSRYAHRTIGNTKQIFYGENLYGIHSIVYDRLPDYFNLFAIYDHRSGFLDWDETTSIARSYDFTVVPELWRGVVETPGQLKLIIDKLIKAGSHYGDTIEGLVVRPVAGFGYSEGQLGCVGKWVRKDHVQTDQHWKLNWKKATII